MTSKWITSTAAAALVMACVYPASAASLVYDGFDYPVGSQLTTQNGGTGFLGGAWSASANYTIGSGSLSFSNLQTTGNHVTFGQTDLSGAQMQRDINNPGFGTNGTTAWLSFLLRPDVNNQSLFYMRTFDLEVGKTDTSTSLYKVANASSPSDTQTSSLAIVPGATIFVAIQFQFNSNPNANDTATVYFDPTPGMTPTSGGIVESSINFPTLNNSFSAFAGNGAGFSLDEVRIGATFQDVSPLAAVPEPSTWAMMLLGFVGLGFASYRRTRRFAIAA